MSLSVPILWSLFYFGPESRPVSPHLLFISRLHSILVLEAKHIGPSPDARYRQQRLPHALMPPPPPSPRILMQVGLQNTPDVIAHPLVPSHLPQQFSLGCMNSRAAKSPLPPGLLPVIVTPPSFPTLHAHPSVPLFRGTLGSSKSVQPSAPSRVPTCEQLLASSRLP